MWWFQHNSVSQISIYALHISVSAHFRFFGANDSQIRKNDYASRLAEMEKNAHSVGLVQNLLWHRHIVRRSSKSKIHPILTLLPWRMIWGLHNDYSGGSGDDRGKHNQQLAVTTTSGCYIACYHTALSSSRFSSQLVFESPIVTRPSRTLVTPPSRLLAALAGCRITSHRPFIAPPSRCLITLS